MLRVYLDSSDFSVLSDPRRTQAQEVRELLNAHVEAGVIEIRFSSLHPLEAAHIQDGAKPMAVKRAELINELCGRKCFRWWHGLVEEEAVRLALGRPLEPEQYALRDDGRWFPPLDGIANDLGPIVEDELKKGFSTLPLPRTQRRLLQKRLYKNKRLTDTAMDLMRARRQEVLDELKGKYPLPERFFDEDFFFRYLAGELSAQIIIDALEEGFGNLSWFVGWVYDRHDPERQLTNWLRSGTLMETIEKLREQVADLAERGALIGKSEKDVNSLIRQTRKQLLKVRARILWANFGSLGPKLKRQGVTKSRWQTAVIDSPFGAIPSLDAVLDVAIEYFQRNLMVGGNERELMPSDFGDLMHMGYLPYVDLFRCDGYAAELSRKTAAKFGTEVVSKLSVLPSAIARRRSTTGLAHPSRSDNAPWIGR